MEDAKSWLVLCPRCGNPLEEKTNLMSERVYQCNHEGCDYRFRPKPQLRRYPDPDPRRVQSKGI